MISRRQLISLGASVDAIRWRLAMGRLIVVHRGVYLVGHRATPPRAREMAAVLACAGGAVVSHCSAAAMWGLIGKPAAGIVEVTLDGSRSSRRRGIVIHRGRLDARDVRRIERIPVTSPARTLLDLAAILAPDELEAVVAEACVRRLTTVPELRRRMDAYSRRPGVPALRAVLAIEGGPARTRSKAERRLLALVRAAALPAPATNATIGSYEVDLLWRSRRVVVEVDGWAFHSSRRAFEDDRARDADLQARGYKVIRVTWRQVTGQPETVIARIAAALARSAPRAAS